METNRNVLTFPMIGRFPGAVAIVSGSPEHPHLSGRVSFFAMQQGTLVMAQITGLPMTSSDNACTAYPVFGFHIHEGDSCTGTAGNPFANAGAHYNPHGCEHPYHVGDMPPLFGNDGYALSAFYTNKFSPSEVIGKTVIVHSAPDDFTTQPSGNAGNMIACGEIVRAI